MTKKPTALISSCALCAAIYGTTACTDEVDGDFLSPAEFVASLDSVQTENLTSQLDELRNSHPWDDDQSGLSLTDEIILNERFDQYLKLRLEEPEVGIVEYLTGNLEIDNRLILSSAVINAFLGNDITITALFPNFDERTYAQTCKDTFAISVGGLMFDDLMGGLNVFDISCSLLSLTMDLVILRNCLKAAQMLEMHP